MSWEDVFFSRHVEPEAIIRALARVFEIEEDTIALEYGWGWHAGLEDDRIQILCRLDIVRGEFPIRLQIGFWAGWKKAVPSKEHYTLVAQLCQLLNNPALVKSGSRTPFIWAFIRGKGDYQYVMVEGRKLNEDEELEIMDELYRFNQPISPLERELGNLLTRKSFDTDVSDREFFTRIVRNHTKEELLPILSNIRLEARRVGREDVIDEAIAQLEARSSSDSSF